MKDTINFGKLPKGQASNSISNACLVIEGGAFRGVYAQGVTDLLMEHNINTKCTIGCSAGALTGMNYVSGQIGRAININLKYRHDSRYVGWKAINKNRSLIGFNFVLNEVNEYTPFDLNRFLLSDRQFYAVATNIETGKPCYFNKADFQLAVQASASMPFLSKPVMIGESLYLDGGCSDSIPYQWAIEKGYQKIIVVRTRERSYRKKAQTQINLLKYSSLSKKHPVFYQALKDRPKMYNQQCDVLEELIERNQVLCISPSKPVTVSRLEKNLSNLEDLYWMGYQDAEKMLPKLESYLES
ncbi:patatin-like phospholipase family protein (plasmid) [Enterococcus sp. 22-H-5-01]|uniref:patatin-like phospholipase family protein n=1 Tax=Enterococcus sp. 22-H-5-01 TaxID=3418555 RepID=UPI003D04EE5D